MIPKKGAPGGAVSWGNAPVAGSIPDGVIENFHWHNPSGRTMALRSTPPLTEMSTRNTSWGSKGGRCVGLTTLPPSCADCLEIWKPQPPGPSGPVQGLLDLHLLASCFQKQKSVISVLIKENNCLFNKNSVYWLRSTALSRYNSL